MEKRRLELPGGPDVLPATGSVGGQVVRTPPPILCVWLVHEAVAAGVIKEMYTNFQLF